MSKQKEMGSYIEVGSFIGEPEKNPMAFGKLISRVQYGVRVMEPIYEDNYWLKKMIEPV